MEHVFSILLMSSFIVMGVYIYTHIDTYLIFVYACRCSTIIVLILFMYKLMQTTDGEFVAAIIHIFDGITIDALIVCFRQAVNLDALGTGF